MLSRILKEPLIHFLLIGACLFGLYAWVNPDAMQSDRRIVVDQGRVNNLIERFQGVWQRQPTGQELQGLIEDYVIEEIYYRQALALGIDKNDPLIRRRLRQKMEFFTANASSMLQASDQQLTEYLQHNAEKFRKEARYSFEQIFLSNDQPEDLLQKKIAATQTALAHNQNVSSDQTLLPLEFNNATESEINKALGLGFSKRLTALPLQQWSAPLRTNMGVHFVKINAKQDRSLPGLEEVRSLVQREWSNEQHQQLQQALKEKLLSEYDVIIRPDTAGGDS